VSEDDLTTGGALIVEWMEQHDVPFFFQLPGESFLPVLAALRGTPKIRTVTTRHESGASFAAEAASKLTQHPAVCMATRGPGAANLSIGIQTAFYDATPLIGFVGLIPRRLQGSRAFQEFDPLSFFGSISKRVFVVNDREALPDILEQGWDLAIEGRPGPVVIGLPEDILSEPRVGVVAGPKQVESLCRGALEVGDVVDCLSRARRPAIVVATEPRRGSTAEQLEVLAEQLGAQVFCAWRHFSAFNNEHPYFGGSIGLGAQESGRDRLDKADLVLSFGFGLDQITCDAGNLNRDIPIFVFAAQAEPELRRRLPLAKVTQYAADPLHAAKTISGSLAAVGGFPQAVVTASGPMGNGLYAPSDALSMDYLMQQIDAIVADNGMIVSDAGNFSQWLLRGMNFGGDRVFLGPRNGAMGYGLPGGIGAVLADPTRPCWVFAGDGGFLMTASELETAVRLGLSIGVFVFDNGLYGTIRAKQEQIYPGQGFGTSVGSVDFAELARASGWHAWTVRSDREVDSVLSEASRETGCRLIHFVTPAEPLSPAAR
jgi:acetolactate synthase-1/2/3 large subunit